MFEALERGTCGLMPGSSIISIYVRIFNEFTNGSKDKAFEHYNKLIPYYNALAQTTEMFNKLEKHYW